MSREASPLCTHRLRIFELRSWLDCQSLLMALADVCRGVRRYLGAGKEAYRQLNLVFWRSLKKSVRNRDPGVAVDTKRGDALRGATLHVTVRQLVLVISVNIRVGGVRCRRWPKRVQSGVYPLQVFTDRVNFRARLSRPRKLVDPFFQIRNLLSESDTLAAAPE